MRRCLLFVALLGCGAPSPVASGTPPPSSAAPSVAASPAPPDDFRMEIGGAPLLRRGPQPGEMIVTTRLEPRPDAPGHFDLVQRSEPAPPSEGTPSIEMRRAQVADARVSGLYAMLAGGRSVLERACVNMQVEDGESHFVRVHERGADAEYRCTNTSTPELDALTSGFTSLVDELLPPLAES